MGLTGAGRPLHHHTGLGAHEIHDAALLLIGRQREQRIGTQHVTGDRTLPVQPCATLLRLGLSHQLSQRYRDLGTGLPQRDRNLLVRLGEQRPAARPHQQRR